MITHHKRGGIRFISAGRYSITIARKRSPQMRSTAVLDVALGLALGVAAITAAETAPALLGIGCSGFPVQMAAEEDMFPRCAIITAWKG